MKKLAFIIFIVFTFCSCANEASGSYSKKEIMDSWAWKMIIFTDLGEFTPVENTQNKFDNTTKVKPTFVEDVLDIYTNDELFLNNQKEEFNDPIVFANLNSTKRKK